MIKQTLNALRASQGAFKGELIDEATGKYEFERKSLKSLLNTLKKYRTYGN